MVTEDPQQPVGIEACLEAPSGTIRLSLQSQNPLYKVDDVLKIPKETQFLIPCRRFQVFEGALGS